MSGVNPERDVYTVGRLNREARMLLESGLPRAVDRGRSLELQLAGLGALVFHAEGPRGADPLRHVSRAQPGHGLPAA